MSRVFADTFYFLALLNKKDEAHQKALEYSTLTGRDSGEAASPVFWARRLPRP
jgi:hypothetical protein